MIRIIHISDIHFQDKDKESSILDKFIEDLNKLDENDIGIFLISGDLINKGGLGFNSLDDAFKIFNEKFINKILSKTNLKRDNIFFCPGNHDIDRNEINEYEELGIKGKIRKEGQAAIDEIMQKAYKDIKKGASRIKAYKNFEKNFYNNNDNKNFTNFESTYKLNIEGNSIGISSLNSCWRCCDKEEELVLGYQQIENSYKLISDCDIKILMMHHSYEFFTEIERRKIKDYVEKYYDYIFLGHVHSGDSYNTIGLHGSIFTCVSQSHSILNENNSSVEYTMGYSIVDIDLEKYKIVFKNRRYVPKLGKYVKNVDLLGDDGYKEYSILRTEEREEQNLLKDIIKRISDTHLQDFDEHLLSYKTDSKAPKTIDEIFVQPKIIREKQYDIDKKKDEVIYDIHNIIEEKNNILLVGTKESGKTILLDKIIIDLVKKFDIYGMIPVKINLRDGSRIESDIRKFLGISNSKVSKLIQENRLILIVDNLDYSIEGRSSFDKLKDFISRNKSLKVICSCETRIEKELPMEIIGDNTLKSFSHLYIDRWDSYQIESLIGTWFCNAYDNYNIKVSDISKIFKNINMSMTPLNISMFLWILEHQKNHKLVNDGKLIECFFEHLLEKLAFEDVYSDTFDYTNKMRLLSNIAYQMYKNDKLKYKLSREDIDLYMSNYIRNRKFSVKNEVILEYFIDKGILIEQQQGEKRIVAFRFECFFRFFLMQYMMIDAEFKDFILQEENYLNFDSEIDYYTGIKRDEEKLLKELHERMKNEFEYLNEFINQRHGVFDNFFEVSKSITESFDITQIEVLKDEKNTSREIIHKEKRAIEDRQIDIINKNVSIGDIEEKNNNDNLLDRLYAVWTLVAKVLKNTEETNNGELKNIVYEDMIRCSMLFAITYKAYIDKFIENELNESEDEDSNKLLKELRLTSRFIPLMHQDLLSSLIGTTKLEIVINEEIDKIIDDSNISELEKFINVFTLFNINTLEGINYIKKLTKLCNKNYIQDIIFMKLMYHYRINELNEILDKEYLNIIGDILSKGKTGRQRYEAKGEIISNIRMQKLLERSKSKETI